MTTLETIQKEAREEFRKKFGGHAPTVAFKTWELADECEDWVISIINRVRDETLRETEDIVLRYSNQLYDHCESFLVTTTDAVMLKLAALRSLAKEE